MFPHGRGSCCCDSPYPGPADDRPGGFEDESDVLAEGEPTMATIAPSGSMAFELDHSTTDPDLLSDREMVDAIIGFDQVGAWATARQQELIAAFHRRPDNGAARPASPAGSTATRDWAAEEIGLALTLAPQAGATRVAAADRLAGVLRPTRDLLEAGRISPDRARLLTDMLWTYDDDIAAAVQDRVLPRAPELTWGQLRAVITRAILAVVPDAGQRHRSARRERRVDVYPGQDGMATLSAWLTATEATASFEWVTRLARGVRPGPDGTGTDETGTGTARGRGSMDRRRADVLVALLTGRLIATAAASATATVPATGGTGCDADGPNEPGAAPPADPVAEDIDPNDTDTASPADTGVDAAPPTPTDDAVAEDPTRTGPAGSPTTDAVPAPTKPGGSDPAWVLAAPVSAHRPLIHITMPLSTLLGLDDEPADLAGYGPLPADVARQIALDPTCTWRRLITDPVSGALLDHGRTTYRPPTALAGFVRTRDGTCRYPGCLRPALACELDHIQPWARGGTTSEDNLCALCERHHDLKEQQGWQVTLHADRTVEWITPTGHHYRSHPVQHPIPPHPPDTSRSDTSRADMSRFDTSLPRPDAARPPGTAAKLFTSRPRDPDDPPPF